MNARREQLIDLRRLGDQEWKILRTKDFLPDAQDDPLLPHGAPDIAVTASLLGMAAARVRQCRLPVQMAHSPTGDPYAVLPAAEPLKKEVLVIVDIDTMDHIYEPDKGVKIHLRVVLNRHAEEMRDGLHRQRR